MKISCSTSTSGVRCECQGQGLSAAACSCKGPLSLDIWEEPHARHAQLSILCRPLKSPLVYMQLWCSMAQHHCSIQGVGYTLYAALTVRTSGCG